MLSYRDEFAVRLFSGHRVDAASSMFESSRLGCLYYHMHVNISDTSITSDGRYRKCRIDIVISNRILSDASIVNIAFSIYHHAQFLFLMVDFIFLDSNAGNKELMTGQIDNRLSIGI